MFSKTLFVLMLVASVIFFLQVAHTATAMVKYDSLMELVLSENSIELEGDVNGDYVVDEQDFMQIEEVYGTKTADVPADINGDGMVNIYDLKTAGMNYGKGMESADCANLSIQPSSITIGPTETFTINVSVDTTDLLYAAYLKLSFNKSIVVATFADEGQFFKSDGADTFSIISIDNDTGLINFDCSRVGADVGINGSGVLLSVTFKAVGDGVSPLLLAGYEAIDDQLYTISIVSVTNSTATVHTNRAPTISSYSPTNLTPSVNEGSSLAFSVTASDPDSDPLTYSWKLDGAQVGALSSYTYNPDFNAAGIHTVIANVTDPGKLFASRQWTVTVKDVPITCSQNSQCGTDGYIGSTMCSGNTVVRTYRTYTCNNPGQPSSYCSSVDSNNTQETCSYKCITGACVSNQAPTITAYSPLSSPVSINEGQSQAFSITASDPYGDPLTYSWRLNGTAVSSTSSYTYTSGYTSAGTYTVLANVSDGVYFATRSWQMVVSNVNRAPTISSYTPVSLAPSVNEGSSLAFSVVASDPDSDLLTYSWKLDGTQISTASYYTYNPDYTSSGQHIVQINVSDGGKLFATVQWTVIIVDVPITCSQNSQCGTDGYVGSTMCSGNAVVRTYRTYTCNNPGTPSSSCSHADVNQTQQTCSYKCVSGACVSNQAPTIDSSSPSGSTATINEGQSQAFSVSASDLYGDPLTYSWKLGSTFVGTAASYTYVSDYNSAGTYTVLANVSDGVYSATRSWQLVVNNVNRAPTINSYSPTSLTPSVNEGSSLAFSAVASDPDGDAVSYVWKLDGTQVSTSSSYTYNPGYTSSGSHAVTVTVSDGSLSTTNTWTVTVNDIHTISIPLSIGNNAVQLTVRPVNTSVPAVLSSVAGKYNSVMVYNASIAGEEWEKWLVYDPARPAFLNTLNVLDERLPFNINMLEAATLAVNII
jgi:hypothetical protein